MGKVYGCVSVFTWTGAFRKGGYGPTTCGTAAGCRKWGGGGGGACRHGCLFPPVATALCEAVQHGLLSLPWGDRASEGRSLVLTLLGWQVTFCDHGEGG